MEEQSFEERRDAFVNEALEGFYRANADEAAIRLLELERNQVVPHVNTTSQVVYLQKTSKRQANFKWLLIFKWALFIAFGLASILIPLLTPAVFPWVPLFCVSVIGAVSSAIWAAV